MPRDRFPSVGYDPASGFAWGGGYVGQGVAASNLAGRTLADLITEEKSDLTTLPWVNHRSGDWEREPIRWIGHKNMWSLFGLADYAAEHNRPGLRGFAEKVAGRFL